MTRHARLRPEPLPEAPATTSQGWGPGADESSPAHRPRHPHPVSPKIACPGLEEGGELELLIVRTPAPAPHTWDCGYSNPVRVPIAI
jgi:hypothetical protein